jgi:hypothetical protein
MGSRLHISRSGSPTLSLLRVHPNRLGVRLIHRRLIRKIFLGLLWRGLKAGTREKCSGTPVSVIRVFRGGQAVTRDSCLVPRKKRGSLTKACPERSRTGRQDRQGRAFQIAVFLAFFAAWRDPILLRPQAVSHRSRISRLGNPWLVTQRRATHASPLRSGRRVYGETIASFLRWPPLPPVLQGFIEYATILAFPAFSLTVWYGACIIVTGSSNASDGPGHWELRTGN